MPFENSRMRSLLLGLLLCIAANATPLEFPSMDGKGRGFTIEVGGEWTPLQSNTTSKIEQKYEPGPDYPQSLSGFPTNESDAAKLVQTLKMVQQMTGKKEYEEVKLGPLPAMLKREKTSFTVYAGHGTTKYTIHYSDGRDSLDRTPYDGILSEILNSFRLAPAK